MTVAYSVCLSVTYVYCGFINENVSKLLTHYDWRNALGGSETTVEDVYCYLYL